MEGDFLNTDPEQRPEQRLDHTHVIADTVEEFSRLLTGDMLLPAGSTAPGMTKDRMELLVRRLVESNAPRATLVAAIGAKFALFPPTASVDDDLVEAMVAAARVSMSEKDDAAQVLGALALSCMASSRWRTTATSDLGMSAEVLRRREQHAAASRTLDLALSRSTELSDEDLAWTHLTAARMRPASTHFEQARDCAAGLPPGAAVWKAIQASERATASSTGDLAQALSSGRAAEAAAIYLSGAEGANLDHSAPVVDGFSRFLHEMASPAPTAEAMRAALVEVVRHIRHVQRLDQQASVANTVADAAVELLLVADSQEATNVLAEFLEALADAGLSEVAPARVVDLLLAIPDLNTAQLRRVVQTDVLWPDMTSVMSGLSTRRQGLILRPLHGRDGSHTFIAAGQFRYPAGFSRRHSRLTAAQLALVSACSTGAPDSLSGLERGAVDDLVQAAFPTTLLSDIASGSVQDLVLAPSGALWMVPWSLSSLLAGTSVRLAPSLGIGVGHQNPQEVRSITIMVDQEIDAAWDIVDTVRELRRAGRVELRVTQRISDVAPCDLLIVYGHGLGAGLDFAMSVADEPISSVALAMAPADQLVVASCWSGGTPAASVPVNMPVLALLCGRSRVVAGLWSVPAASMSRLVSRALRDVAAGVDLDLAVQQASADMTPYEAGGVVLFGA